MFIFMDESGDLGFDFETKPRTSAFFTITLLVCDSKIAADGVSRAVRRTLKNKVKFKSKKNLSSELKGTHTDLKVKRYFLNQMPETGWYLYAITLNKNRVYQNLRTKGATHKLYNFVTKELMKELNGKNSPAFTAANVNLTVDQCKNSKDRKDFNAYIQSHLETAFPLETSIYISHESSQNTKGLQAVDLFCWGIHRWKTSGDATWYNLFKEQVVKVVDYLPASATKEDGKKK